MTLIKKSNRFILSLLAFTTLTPLGYTQQSNTMYFMRGIPQTIMLNPASQPKCEVFVGIPGVSCVGADVANNALCLNDIMYWSDNLDSTVFALNPDEGDKDELLDNFGKKNFISQQANVTLITFGFRSNDYYFSFAYNVKVASRFLYPEDYFRYAVNGGGNGAEFDLSSFRFDVTAYQEFSFGMSKKLSPYFYVGGNTKILFGLGNVTQRNTKLKFKTTPFVIPVNVRFDNNMNIPLLEVEWNENNQIWDIGLQDTIEASDVMKNAFAFKNFGLGFDLGAHYSIKELTLSASIIDLGFIRWNSHPVNLKEDEIYEMRGLNFIPAFDNLFDLDTLRDAFIDSVESNLLVYKGTEAAYTTALAAKIYLGATYRLTPQMQVGILSRSEFFKKKLYQQLTLSASFLPDKVMSPTISYTMMNKSYNNIGLGLSFRGGWGHMYLITDNIPLTYAKEASTGYPIPHKAKSVNIHFGINLLFGCNKMKKLMNDQPIIQ